MGYLSENDCEEIGTAVGMLTIKLFKFIFEVIEDLKRLTGLFNPDEKTHQS